MAKEKPNNERTEREFQLDVNQAVANTEGEIFEDALGDEPLENDDERCPKLRLSPFWF